MPVAGTRMALSGAGLSRAAPRAAIGCALSRKASSFARAFDLGGGKFWADARRGLAAGVTRPEVVAHQHQVDKSLAEEFWKKFEPNRPDVTTLSNGLRVATQRRTAGQAVALGVWIDAGSRYEEAECNGVAHFLEHLVTKGTTRRSREALEREIEFSGSHLNAYTSREHTAFNMRVLPSNIGFGIDLLGDVLLNSKLTPADIDRERSVILREMEEVYKSASEVVFDSLHLKAFKDHPLGNTILGPQENIKNLKRRDLVNYIKNNYTADRMIFVAVGDVEHDAIVKAVEPIFGHVARASPESRDARLAKADSQPAFGSGAYLDEKLWHPQGSNNLGSGTGGVTAAVAWRGVSWADPDCVKSMVMSAVATESFRRWQRGGKPHSLPSLAEVGSQVLQFEGFGTLYSDCGIAGFVTRTSGSPDEAIDVVSALMKDQSQLARHADEEVIECAKASLTRALLATFDNNLSLADEIGRQILTHGRAIRCQEWLESVEAVSAAGVRQLASRLFHPSKSRVIAGTTAGT